MVYKTLYKILKKDYEPTGYLQDGRFNIARYIKDLEVEE